MPSGVLFVFSSVLGLSGDMAKQRRRRQKKGELETMGEMRLRSLTIAGCSDPRLRRSYEQLANELDGVLKLTPGVRFKIEAFVPDQSDRRNLTHQLPLVLTSHTECRANRPGWEGDKQGRDNALWLGCLARSWGVSAVALELRRDQSPNLHWVGLKPEDCWLQTLITELADDSSLNWSYDDNAVVTSVVIDDNITADTYRRSNRALLVSADNFDSNMSMIGEIMAGHIRPGRLMPVSFGSGIGATRRDEITELLHRSDLPVAIAA